MGPQEIESTPWVHTAGYLRARSINSQAHKRGVLLGRQANSLSKLAAPARSASSMPGSQRAESTRGGPQFPKQPACSGWCQAWPQVAAGSASQAHEQPGPQAHGGSISKPHNAESGSTSSQAHKLQQGPNPRARSASSNLYMARRQACPQAAIRSQVQSPS